MNNEFLDLTSKVLELRRSEGFRVSLGLGGWSKSEGFTFSLSVSTNSALCFFEVPHPILEVFETREIPATKENTKKALIWLENLYHETMEYAA